MDQNSRSKRNIIFYIIGVFLFSLISGFILKNGNEAGGLVFILGPFIMAIALRFSSKEVNKWKNLKFNFRKNWLWYLISFLIYPITFLIICFSGIGAGSTIFNSNNIGLFAVTILAQFLPRFLFGFFEEIGWRGYLEAELLKLNLGYFKRHLIVGLVWAVWHMPFIIFMSSHKLPYYIFIPMFFAGVVVLAYIFGQLLEKTGSIWPGIIFHGLSNTIAWSVLTSKLVVVNNPLFFNITPESVLGMLIFATIAYLIIQKRALN